MKTIYTLELIDPDTGEVKNYHGQTNNLSRRLDEHKGKISEIVGEPSNHIREAVKRALGYAETALSVKIEICKDELANELERERISKDQNNTSNLNKRWR